MLTPSRDTVHHVFDGFIGIGGMITCAIVIYLSITNVRNKALRVYTIMLVTNATIDFIYCLNTTFTMCSAAFGVKAVFMSVDNPLVPRTVWWTYAALSTNLFLMFLSVGILPLQFIYRYGLMRSRPFTRLQMLCFGFVSLALATLHGFISPWTFRPPTPEYEQMFREALGVDESYQLPGYVVGDVRQFDIMTLHFLNIFLIVGIVYTVILLAVWLSKRTLTLKDTGNLTTQTKAVQRQVTKIIYIQAIYPPFVVMVPCTLFTVAAAKGIQMRFVAELVMFSMHTPPLANNLIVILCVPSYRRFVANPFKNDRVQSITRLFNKGNATLGTYSTTRGSGATLS